MEKSHFSYNAEIKVGLPKEVDSEDISIQKMTMLSPMVVDWATPTGDGQSFVYLDFVNERVYGPNFQPMTNKLGSELLEILKMKKTEAKTMPLLPSHLIEKAMDTKNRLFEGAANAGKVQL